eukprot:scaffold1849_cov163-Ochromonas_danica.AAC.2
MASTLSTSHPLDPVQAVSEGKIKNECHLSSPPARAPSLKKADWRFFCHVPGRHNSKQGFEAGIQPCWKVDDLIDVLSAEFVYCPAVIVGIKQVRGKPVYRIHYIGWGDSYDEDIKDSKRIFPESTFTKQVKLWAKLSDRLPYWPSIGYIRQPSIENDIGIAELKLEKKIYIRPCGQLNKFTSPYHHGVWLESFRLESFEKDKNIRKVAGLEYPNTVFQMEFQTAFEACESNLVAKCINFRFDGSLELNLLKEMKTQWKEKKKVEKEKNKLKSIDEKETILSQKGEKPIGSSHHGRNGNNGNGNGEYEINKDTVDSNGLRRRQARIKFGEMEDVAVNNSHAAVNNTNNTTVNNVRQSQLTSSILILKGQIQLNVDKHLVFDLLPSTMEKSNSMDKYLHHYYQHLHLHSNQPMNGTTNENQVDEEQSFQWKDQNTSLLCAGNTISVLRNYTEESSHEKESPSQPQSSRSTHQSFDKSFARKSKHPKRFGSANSTDSTIPKVIERTGRMNNNTATFTINSDASDEVEVIDEITITKRSRCW